MECPCLKNGGHQPVSGERGVKLYLARTRGNESISETNSGTREVVFA